MKIVYLVTNLNRCGPYNVIESIMNNLSGNDISIISLFDAKNDKNLIKNLKSKKIKIINLNLTKKNILFAGKKKLKKELKKINPDVVHSNSLLTDLILPANIGKKNITTIHNNMYEYYIMHFGKIMGRFWIVAHKLALKKFDEVICCAENVSSFLNSKGIKCSYIRNGVNVPTLKDKEKQKIKSAFIKKYELVDDAIIYIFCGVLKEGKAPDVLIKEFISCCKNNEYLFICGNGPLYDECKRLANDHVFVLGFIDNLTEYYKAADIYVSFSHTEGLSISVLEALSCKCHLLLSDIPSHKECVSLISNEYLGEIFTNDFSDKKEKVSENIHNKISQNVLDYVSENRMAEEYIEVYKGV